MASKAQQIELDNALVAPENRRVIGKCNMRINPRMKPKESTYQVVLDALALTTCYPAFLITTEVPVIYMHQFWATVTKHKASYRFMINNKRFSVNVEVFRDILNICLSIPSQEFDEPPIEEEALSFIRVEPPKSKKPKTKSDSAISSEETPSKKKPTKAKKDVPSKKNPTFKPKASKKKAPVEGDRGKGDGTDFESGVPDEQQRKTYGTDEGTGTKPGVPNNVNDNDNAKDDDNGNEDDDGNYAHDSERTNSDDDDENPSFTLKDYDEEEHDEECESDDDKENVYEEEDDDMYKDVDVRSLGAEYEKERKDDEEMTDADQNVSQEKSYEQEESSTQAPYLFTVPETAIPETSSSHTTTVPPTISMITPLPQLTTPSPAPTTISTTTLILVLPDFSSLFRFDQRVSTLEQELTRIGYATRTALLSYTKEFEKKAQEERKLYIDVVEKSVKDIIKDEVKSQLPRILSKEVSDFATPVIQSTINELLENVVLAKSSSQTKSIYEAAASLIEFELKKILLDKIEKSKSYQAAPEHRELYDGLVKSYNLDKDIFSSYGNVYSLKRDREDEDKDKDPPAGSNQGLKKQKTSKDVEPSRCSKSKEFKSSSSKGSKSNSKSSGKSAQAEEPVFETAGTEMTQDQGDDIGNTKDQPNVEEASKHDWFKKPEKPPTPDHD
ncbi:hypothetical protein Tco_0116194 [Tanacetum coccineum]